MQRSIAVRRFGITLTEVLVVLAIIGLLLILLFPAVQAARASARRTVCANKMRQLGLAIHHYFSLFDQFPPSKWGIESPSDSRLKHNILTFILPFLEQETLYSQFDFRFNWNESTLSGNLRASRHHLPVFHCPDAPRETSCRNQEFYVTDYAVAEQMYRTTGKIKPLFDNGVVSPRTNLYGMLQPPTVVDPGNYLNGSIPWTVTETTVSDGLSNTMMFVECAGRPFKYEHGYRSANTSSPTEPLGGANWASNSSPFYIQESCGSGGMQLFNCNNFNEMYSFHPGGSNFLFGDKTIHYLTTSTHPELFISLFTAFAGDPTPTL